jgi:hypothetical protein
MPPARDAWALDALLSVAVVVAAMQGEPAALPLLSLTPSAILTTASPSFRYLSLLVRHVRNSGTETQNPYSRPDDTSVCTRIDVGQRGAILLQHCLSTLGLNCTLSL